MECTSLEFRCQCTQQKLQSICTVLMSDPQLKKNLNIFCKRQISIKLSYLYQRLPCRDNYFFKIKFVFFLYLLLSASWKENDLPLIYFWYQTDSGVPNTSIYSAAHRWSSCPLHTSMVIMASPHIGGHHGHSMKQWTSWPFHTENSNIFSSPD
jgi:hypothetical protein